MPKLEPYHKKLPYSYALGVFACLNLLDHRPELARRLLLHPDGLGSEGVEKLRARCAALNIREEMSEKALRRESRKDNCYAGLVFDKFDCELNPMGMHVVLNNISDGGNLGTILRTCVGFGVDSVAVIRPAVDAFDPRVIRASMGAVFQLSLGMFDSFEAYRAAHPSHALYPFMLDGARTLADVARERCEPCALVFGSEQSGLPTSFAKLGQSVKIPQAAGIDSYNLAVSAAIGLYAFTQTRE